MKSINLALICALALLSSGAFAQRRHLTLTPYDTVYTINTRRQTITYEGKDALTQNKKDLDLRRWHWNSGSYTGVNLFYSGLTGKNLGSLPGNGTFMESGTKSIGVDINLLDFVIYSHRRFGIVSGLGLESNNFNFNNNMALTTGDNDFTQPDYSYADRGVNLTKSKLTTTYLNIPLMFQFRLGSVAREYRGTWLSLGVVGGIRLQSYNKIKSREEGKQRNFGDFNLRNLHWGVMVSAGMGIISINAKYFPQSIFRNGYGPHVEQFSVGVGINLDFK